MNENEQAPPAFARNEDGQTSPPGSETAEPARREEVPEAAKRALAEAEERRRAIDERARRMPREIGGRGGEEPIRYGDWEKNGLAVDF